MNICKIFGNGTTVSGGKVHDYIGIDMDWYQDGTMIVSMIKYSQKIFDDFPEVICSNSATYAAEYLFTVHTMRRKENYCLRSRHKTSIKL